MTGWEGVHTCSDQCPCHAGGEPVPDFVPGSGRGRSILAVIGPERLTITTDRKGEPLQLGGFIEHVDPWATKAGCVNVEYVRADLHRGAVQEIERLRGVLTVITAANADDAASFARAALQAGAPITTFGGQSDPVASPRKEQS